MRLTAPSNFAAIFEPLQGKRVGFVQGVHGNAGDGLIHHATLSLFKHFRVSHVIVNTASGWAGGLPAGIDHLVLFGGGNMGYPGSGRVRASAMQNWHGPVTLLPQSWLRPVSEDYPRMFARERYSIDFCPRASLAPDLALAFECTVSMPPAIEELGICLRADHESIFGGQRNDPAAGLSRLDAVRYIERAAAYRTIITDRLHFAISGLICCRKVTLLPNSYHKNRGVWEAWLADLGCRWAPDLPTALQEL